ncbi:sensor histidine kinase [Chitinophagaceae bacterium MMS25-I14]
MYTRNARRKNTIEMPTDCTNFSLLQFAEMVNAVIWLYDVQRSEPVFASTQLQQQLGHSSHTPLQDIIAPEYWPSVEKQLRSYTGIRQHTDTFALRCNLVHSDGSTIPYTLKTAVYEENTDKTTLIITAERIHNKEAEQELLKRTRIIEETEQILHFGSYEWQLDTDTWSWSDGLYAVLGYSKNDVQPQASYEFLISHIVTADRLTFEKAMHNALHDKCDTDVGYRIATASGEVRYVISSFRIITSSATGKPVKVIGTTRDITPIKLAEEKQALYVHELNRSNKDLEEFAYVASHDLQEPLRKISTFVDRLTSKYGNMLNDEGRMYFERIIASTNNMRALIDNLLEFSRVIQPGHHFSKTNLGEIISEVVRDQELIIEETGTIIHWGDMPVVNGVPAQLKQLFNNLFSNAIKFRSTERPCIIEISSRKAPETVIARTGLTAGKEYYQLTVNDNGIGFEKEYAERIFKIFQRLHGKAEYPGTGIGLAICKKIADHHNGAIFADSVPGQGASFSILLPA